MCTSFSISPSSRLCTGIPVQLATTSATFSAETSSLSIGEPRLLLVELAAAACSSSRSSCGSRP